MRYLFAGLAVAVAVACGGGAPARTPTAAPTLGSPVTTPAPGGLPTAEQLCALLTADDWGQFNFVTAAQPEINSDDLGSAYCVYAGTSGATGGLELDAFVDASDEDAQATFDTIADETQDAQDITLAGADEAIMSMTPFGSLTARAGRFTFTISLPAGEQAEVQLGTLAGIVLARSAAYQ